MLRVVLITVMVLLALRFFARLSAAFASAAPAAHPPEREHTPRAPAREQTKPQLSDAERAALEAERELALREGRQIDAIKIQRQLTGR